MGAGELEKNIIKNDMDFVYNCSWPHWRICFKVRRAIIGNLMLLKIRQLVIENLGYKRNISTKNIYLNSANIVSVADYSGAETFLLSEGSQYSSNNFSLIRVGHGNTIEEVIAFGEAEEIYSLIRGDGSTRRLLND